MTQGEVLDISQWTLPVVLAMNAYSFASGFRQAQCLGLLKADCLGSISEPCDGGVRGKRNIFFLLAGRAKLRQEALRTDASGNSLAFRNHSKLSPGSRERGRSVNLDNSGDSRLSP